MFKWIDMNYNLPCVILIHFPWLEFIFQSIRPQDVNMWSAINQP